MARYYDDKAQELKDSSMIGSGNGAFSNMPTEVVFKPYATNSATLPEGLDDTIKGIDSQVGGDESKMHAKLSPKKV